MASTARLESESWLTGISRPAADAPSSAVCDVLYAEFGVPGSRPLPGGTPVSDYLKHLEADTRSAAELAAARRRLAQLIGVEPQSLRGLRLAAGLSQTILAERAGSTQPYIARIEAGSADPSTDMLARIANALGVDAVNVFAAIRAQRGHVTNVG